MKNIKVYEFKDLTKDIKKETRDKLTNEEVEFEIDELTRELENGLLTEKEYYNTLGCDKNYAETTSWFVPSCYYDKNKKEVDREVKKMLSRSVYTINGRYIQ